MAALTVSRYTAESQPLTVQTYAAESQHSHFEQMGSISLLEVLYGFLFLQVMNMLWEGWYLCCGCCSHQSHNHYSPLVE